MKKKETKKSALENPTEPSSSSPKNTKKTTTTSTVTSEDKEDVDAQFVLTFLRKRGLDKAALELENHVELKKGKSDAVEAIQVNSLNSSSSSTNNKDQQQQKEEEGGGGGEEQDEESKALDILEKKLKISQTPFQRSTGGGIGYDLDSGGTILPWGILSYHQTDEEDDELALQNSQNNYRGEGKGSASALPSAGTEKEKKMRMEVMTYLKSFVVLQTWVLSLPDDQYVMDPSDSSSKENIESSSTTQQELKGPQHYHSRIIPASCKFELLSVCFPLFVYIYCDLLACGLEERAASFLQQYHSIYEPTYTNELFDLQRCNSTHIYMDMNRSVKYATEVVNEIHLLRSSIQSLKKKKKDMQSVHTDATSMNHVEEEIHRRESTLRDLSRNAITISKKLLSFPFLQKIGLRRLNVCVSQLSYLLLANILNRDAFSPMCAMLQSRCYLSVQRREPLPYIPPCVFEDSIFDKEEKEDLDDVAWAAPIHPVLRAAEAGEDISRITSILNHTEELPFPQLFLKNEYDSNSSYEKDKRTVEFNRALLIHGFRRLEALELKQEYDNGTRKAKQKDLNEKQHETSKEYCNALSPSILLTTLCTVTGNSKHNNTASRPLALDSPSMGITSARICPPDGRRVATGCEDSAIRIWSMDTLNSKQRHVHENEDYVPTGEASTILLGHKNGFPVYDVDWNRDGRTLLSAGGDGTLRLWDTMAVGPFGRLANIRRVTHTQGVKSSSLSSRISTKDPSSLNVPGEKSDSLVEIHGAALACYRGHSLSTPIWSASFAPCGYYFASAGSDSTARLWCTDRPAPIRIFSGHFSPSVNNVTWHPNCNYILSCGDDKTVRMWDIQSGRSVRILTGSSSGLGIVRVCPSGKYAAAADYSGIVHVWELGSGKRINELRHISDNNASSCDIFSLCYSSCGTAIATGTKDCTVRVWDAKGMNINSNKEGLSNCTVENEIPCSKFGERTPVKVFRTHQTSILDLQYNRRNLLFAVGKYT